MQQLPDRHDIPDTQALIQARRVREHLARADEAAPPSFVTLSLALFLLLSVLSFMSIDKASDYRTDVATQPAMSDHFVHSVAAYSIDDHSRVLTARPYRASPLRFCRSFARAPAIESASVGRQRQFEARGPPAA